MAEFDYLAAFAPVQMLLRAEDFYQRNSGVPDTV
jgi:hypothetical protein